VASPVLPAATDRDVPVAAESRAGLWQRLLLVLGAVELTLVYGPTVSWMWARWTENVWEHAHGLLIVPLVGYFISQELNTGKARPAAPSAWGFVLLVGGLLLHVVDTGMNTQLLSAASLLLVLPGLLILTVGIQATRAVAFPLSLLVLALPIPLAFTERIHLELREFVTATLGIIIPRLGIPTYAEGTTLFLGGSSLEIADACSGFTTLYAAVAVALLTAYSIPSARRRILVLASAVPLAVAANLLRVLILALLVEWRGSGILDTFIHPLSGIMTFALALPIIFWLGGDAGAASRPRATA
jgi:exosortase